MRSNPWLMFAVIYVSLMRPPFCFVKELLLSRSSALRQQCTVEQTERNRETDRSIPSFSSLSPTSKSRRSFSIPYFSVCSTVPTTTTTALSLSFPRSSSFPSLTNKRWNIGEGETFPSAHTLAYLACRILVYQETALSLTPRLEIGCQAGLLKRLPTLLIPSESLPS